MKKRNLVLVILAIMLVFGLVSCGPTEPPTAAEVAAKYFSANYKAVYKSGDRTKSYNEYITLSIDKLKIEEKEEISGSLTTVDSLVFDIEKWEFADSIPSDIVDPSAGSINTVFKDGLKITGKITAGKNASQGGYIGSTQTSPGFVDADKNTECWMYLYLGDSDWGNALVRSPFSKNETGKNNETKHSVGTQYTVTPTGFEIRVYYNDH